MKALSFGELLFDMIQGKAHIGGAPFNLLAHLARMGFCSSYISAVGFDDLGKQALREAHRLRIDTEWIRIDPDNPTGKATVTGEEHQSYEISGNAAWDHIALGTEDMKMIHDLKWSVFCYGTLAQRSENNRSLLKEICLNVNAERRFYDLNLREGHYQEQWIRESLDLADIAKMNMHEAEIVSQMLYKEQLPQETFAARLREDYNLVMVCITSGSKGSMFAHKGGTERFPAKAADTVDATGAGDSFSAGFLYLFLQGYSIAEAADFAAELSAFVVSREGAVPEYSDEIKKKIISLHKDPLIAKHI